MKRIFLFLLTNLAIMLVLGTVVSLLGVNNYLSQQGMDFGSLLGLAAIMGFGGSLISLFLSKTMAKASTGARCIVQPENAQEQWLVDVVTRLAQEAGISMPEVALYDGAANAFATGPSRNNSLVAVSTGLLQSMSKPEVEAVLAHEIAHVKNGDMVTLTLIQGVVNTFVFFLARVIAYAVDSMMRKQDDDTVEGKGLVSGMTYMATVFICEIVFGILATAIVMYFSRQREFRADRGAANLLGSSAPMIAALQRLGSLSAGALPQNIAASGIAGAGKIFGLFSSHPPLEERIEALREDSFTKGRA